jgi:hypothetical protein
MLAGISGARLREADVQHTMPDGASGAHEQDADGQRVLLGGACDAQVKERCLLTEDKIPIIFWNARGVEPKMTDLEAYVVASVVDVACIMETRSLRLPGYYFVPGPELLPREGKSRPRRGLGVFVSDRG